MIRKGKLPISLLYMALSTIFALIAAFMGYCLGKVI
ncbi:hypothetical protein N752_06685 [Desulforamulus aquiferis]|nr:hypothetical protein N752_06685 [Desulforamulus aquiferis]